MLTYILRGERSMSIESVGQVSDRLGLPEREEEYLRLITERDIARSKKTILRIEKRLSTFRRRTKPLEIPLHLFAPEARWYAMAIVELSALLPFGPESEDRFSRALGITKKQVRETIERLRSFGLLRFDEDGLLRRVHGEISITFTDRKDDADRMHAQILDRAKLAVDSTLVGERIYASAFYALRKERVADFRKKFYALLDEFHDESLREDAPDSVYGLAVAGFKLFDLAEENSR